MLRAVSLIFRKKAHLYTFRYKSSIFLKASTIPLLEHEPVQMLTLNYEVFRVCFRWIHVKGSDLSGYPVSTKMPLKTSLSYILYSMSHFTAKPLKLIKKILSGLTQLALGKKLASASLQTGKSWSIKLDSVSCLQRPVALSLWTSSCHQNTWILSGWYNLGSWTEEVFSHWYSVNAKEK